MRDTIDMARALSLARALALDDSGYRYEFSLEKLKAFEALVRVDERKQIALDKKAENARELGLDYEPVAWMYEDMMGLVGVRVQKEKPIVARPVTPLCLCTPPAQPALVQEPVAWTATRLWNRRELWTCPADIERDLLEGQP